MRLQYSVSVHRDVKKQTNKQKKHKAVIAYYMRQSQNLVISSYESFVSKTAAAVNAVKIARIYFINIILFLELYKFLFIFRFLLR